nr:MAG TPA: hypothetical protein [Microviridae sp.]
MFRKNMARFNPAPSEKIYEVEQSSYYDEDGVLRPSSKLVDTSSPNLPNPDDYTLEKLLAAGVSLNVVNCELLTSVPSDNKIGEVVDNIVSSDNKVD